MELGQHGGYVVRPPSASEHPRTAVHDHLEAADGFCWETIQEGVSIVNPRQDEGVDQGLQVILGEDSTCKCSWYGHEMIGRGQILLQDL